MPIRAFITGCAGPVLTADETAFIRQAEPWGLILFKRNVETPAQVLALELLKILPVVLLAAEAGG